MASYRNGLVDEEYAVAYTRRPASTIRRWANEGRITRHRAYGSRRNGVLYDLDELPRATQDEDSGEWTLPSPPPLPHNREHATAA